MTVRAKAFSAVGAAMLLFASQAQAQVNFYTQGYFTSAFGTCNGPAPIAGAPANASCVGGGFTLNYTAVNTNPGPIASGSVVSLGNFSLTGTGTATVPDNFVQFTLLVRQTAPTVGTGTYMGYITGTVTTDGAGGDFSSIVWKPNQFVNIGPSTYQMIFDNVGPANGVGLAIPINQTRGITALVTTVPEPSTYALMAAGLAGMLVVARRRRNA